jgi:hypothetical protein
VRRLFLLVALLMPVAFAHPALADAPPAPNVIRAGAPVGHITPIPVDTTAICTDGSWTTDWSPTQACGANGGVGQWLAPVVDSPSGPGALATLDTTAHPFGAGGTVARSLAPLAVISSATGPLNIVGALDFHTCQGGPTHVSAVVSDNQGNGVSGATVTGTVQFFASDSTIAFPSTGADGFTETSFNSGDPWGGYYVVFSLHETDAANDQADTTVKCYAP